MYPKEVVDKYGDLMGYAFLHVPRRAVTPGRPVRLRVAGESQGLRTWFMVFKEPLVEGVILRNAPALLRGPNGNRQIVRDLLSLQAAAVPCPVGGSPIRWSARHHTVPGSRSGRRHVRPCA
jgi:hypothetical protein